MNAVDDWNYDKEHNNIENNVNDAVNGGRTNVQREKSFRHDVGVSNCRERNDWSNIFVAADVDIVLVQILNNNLLAQCGS